MLAEAIQALVELTRRGDQANVQKVDELPRKVFIHQGNLTTEFDVPPPERRHDVVGFDDVVSMASDDEISTSPEVYYCSREIKILADRADRRESSTLLFNASARWEKLGKLSMPMSMSPSEAVKMLRFDLHGTGVEAVIQGLSRIDFTRTSGGKSHVDHGKESLGKSVEAAVQQADKVPESFNVNLCPVTNPGFQSIKVDVRCGVYIDLQQERVEIRVLADELDAASNAFTATVGEMLRAALPDVPIFHGTP